MARRLYPFLTAQISYITNLNTVLCYCVQLPLEAIVLLGCYGVGMLAWGLLIFPTCPNEAKLLQDVRNAQPCYKIHETMFRKLSATQINDV